MYNLIIVDDEKIIRRGLKNYIPWDKLGFQVCADFDDGKDAIPYLLTNPVDVVLTDIRMVNVSGLELADYISRNHPSVRTVIISGYKEFDYARQALIYNVKDYLLKPINQDEVINTFRELRNELDKSHDNSTPVDYIGSTLRVQSFTCRKELIKAVIAADKEQIEVLINDIPSFPLEEMQQCSIDFFAALTGRLQELGITFSDSQPLINYQSVYTLNSEKGVLLWLSEKILSLIDTMNAKRSADSESLIEKAVSFIEEHYREDPSREEVADYLSLNSSYFSRLFKERTGRTFSEYVREARIRKAVELMQEGRYRVYEISELVGYNDSKYFARVFKNQTGYKPLDYMRIHNMMNIEK